MGSWVGLDAVAAIRSLLRVDIGRCKGWVDDRWCGRKGMARMRAEVNVETIR